MAGEAGPGQEDGAAARLRRVELAAEPPVRLGPVTVDPPNRRVSHADGREAGVEPRSMKVLVALLRAPGTVFSRDDLFEACWEGRAVSDDAVDRAIMRLRRAIAPVVDDVVAVETVTKVGHRARVRTGGAAAAPAAAPPAPVTASRERRLLPWLGGAIAAAAALIAFYFLVLAPRPPADPGGAGILPFTSADAGDAALAAGLGDDLRATLASRSDLRLSRLDRRAAAPPSDEEAAAMGAARGLAHVIGGDVTRRADRLRIRTWIIDTTTGRRSWSDSVDGRVSGISDLQERVGARVSSAIGLRLLPARAGQATRGEVRALYLRARETMRPRGAPRMVTAIALLRAAEAIDPDYAPVQARLGQAIALNVDVRDAGAAAAAQAEALPHLRRALRLQPDLAEAHGALGMVLGFASDEAAAHIRRAAELDPDDAEIQMWRGHVYQRELDFANQILRYRRAVDLDPLWNIAAFELIRAEAEMGQHDRAALVARRYANAIGGWEGRGALAMLALARHDLSEAFRHLAAMRDPRSGRLMTSDYLAELLEEAGLDEAARAVAPDMARRRTIRDGDRVSVAEVARLDGLADSASDVALTVIYGLKRLINSGEAGSLAARYDRPEGLLGISRLQPAPPSALLFEAPLVALVLRQAGREAEAAALIRRSTGEADRMLRRGPAPGPALAAAAGAFALAGRRDAAIGLLERARRQGWVLHGRDQMPDLAEEPAFASLRGAPRFEAIRLDMLAHRARERAEILALLGSGPDQL